MKSEQHRASLSEAEAAFDLLEDPSVHAVTRQAARDVVRDYFAAQRARLRRRTVVVPFPWWRAAELG